MQNNQVAITLENFQQVILEDSKSILVLVTFWAEQVPESVELRDKLGAGVANFPEHIVHATVDCQTQGQIAQQFGIQGLPTAVVIKDAQPIDGVSGPQTDDAIQAFLAKHLPKEEDILLAQAQEALLARDITKAFSLASQAATIDGERADIKFVLVEAYLAQGKLDEAEALLASVKMVDQDSDYQALVAKCELAKEAADSPEIKALEAKLASAPEDVELIHQLAAQYSQVNRQADALALLFSQVQRDRGDVKSKDLLLDIMKALPDGDALATQYRRKLYTLMY